jgi:streptomycin 6-kinase
MMSEKLNRYMEQWRLSDPLPLAQTVTSELYTVSYGGERAVLKLLTPLGMQEEHRGAIALRYWDGHGAVRLFEADDEAQLLEYADGDDLVPMVRQTGDDTATAIIVDVIRQLHMEAPASPESIPDGLPTLTVWFRALFKQAAADKGAGVDSIYVRGCRIAEALLSNPLDTRVLHGDLHHENIRFRHGRGWLCFDPKGIVGERTFDAANIFRNPLNMPDLVENEARMLKLASILSNALDVEPSRVLAFTYTLCCLSASWYLEDDEEPEGDVRMAAIIEPHLGDWLL